MTIGGFIKTWILTSFLFFFGILGLLFLAAHLKGITPHEPPQYERVRWEEPLMPAKPAKKAKKTRRVQKDANVEDARQAAACHNHNCVHDVRTGARSYLPYIN